MAKFYFALVISIQCCQKNKQGKGNISQWSKRLTLGNCPEVIAAAETLLFQNKMWCKGGFYTTFYQSLMSRKVLFLISLNPTSWSLVRSWESFSCRHYAAFFWVTAPNVGLLQLKWQKAVVWDRAMSQNEKNETSHIWYRARATRHWGVVNERQMMWSLWKNIEGENEKNREIVVNAVVGEDTKIINHHTNCFYVIVEKFAPQLWKEVGLFKTTVTLKRNWDVTTFKTLFARISSHLTSAS